MKPLMERFERLLEFAPEEEVDLYSKKQLRKRLLNWKNRDREYLCKIDYFVNGKEYASLAESIYQIEDMKKIKLKFIKPDLEGDWHFSKPTKELMEKKGKGVCKTFNYDAYSLKKWTGASKVKTEKVMVRAYLTKYFAPISIKTKSQYHHAQDVPARYVPELKNLEDLWADFRDGVVPLEMRLCVYTQNKRYAYIIDAIGDGQIPHPLNHISLPNEAQREPIDYMHIDRILAKYDLPELLKKILELLFHSQELSLPDIAHYFKMETKVAENSLNSLVNKGLVEVRKNVYYRISIENVREIARSLK